MSYTASILDTERKMNVRTEETERVRCGATSSPKIMLLLLLVRFCPLFSSARQRKMFVVVVWPLGPTDMVQTNISASNPHQRRRAGSDWRRDFRRQFAPSRISCFTSPNRRHGSSSYADRLQPLGPYAKPHMLEKAAGKGDRW
jgi:hypothetical protein